MGLLLAYVLKSALCLAVFYLFYRLLLSWETFHTFNRRALLGILLLSTMLPLVRLPGGVTGGMQQVMPGMEQWLMVVDAAGSPDEGDMAQAALPGWMCLLPPLYLAGTAFFLLREVWTMHRLARVLRTGERRPLDGHKGICRVVHDRETCPFRSSSQTMASVVISISGIPLPLGPS